MKCRAELCENWSGDGNVCPCAVFDLTPTRLPISTLTGRPYPHPADMRCVECVSEDEFRLDGAE